MLTQWHHALTCNIDRCWLNTVCVTHDHICQSIEMAHRLLGFYIPISKTLFLHTPWPYPMNFNKYIYHHHRRSVIKLLRIKSRSFSIFAAWKGRSVNVQHCRHLQQLHIEHLLPLLEQFVFYYCSFYKTQGAAQLLVSDNIKPFQNFKTIQKFKSP